LLDKMGKMKKQRNAGKAGKGGQPAAKPLSRTLQRKADRKNARKVKKQKKADFFSRKFAPKEAENDDTADDKVAEEEPSEVVDKAKAEALEKEKRQAEKARKAENERKRQRKKQLLSENRKEEMEIRRLEKNLNVKKRKEGAAKAVKGLSVFDDDGLNDLLNFCDDRPDLDKLMEEEGGGGGGEEDDEDNSDQERSDDDDQDMEESDADHEEDDDEVDDIAEEHDVNDADSDTQEGDEASDEDMDDNDDEVDKDSEEEEEENVGEPKEQFWEDIYGRTRDSKGNVVEKKDEEGGGDNLENESAVISSSNPVVASPAPGKYVPPALRAKLGSDREKRLRLERQVKGQLNRLAESNLHMISRQLEDYYGQNSRNDMNEVLCQLMTDSLTNSPVLTPERLVMEHAVLVAILHANVGTEVGASIVQTLVTQFHEKYRQKREEEESEHEGKTLENYVQLLCQLYAFKVIAEELIFGMLDKFATAFTSKDVELILLALKNVGFLLRKDDPHKLKSLIVKIQGSSAEKQAANSEDSRTKFMLEIVMAIKNNNVKKIPNYDPTHQHHLQKIIKSFLRQGAHVTPMKIGYDELLNAGKSGRWWIVGSAWTGTGPAAEGATTNNAPSSSSGPRFSTQLLELARKMRMNTDARKDIFCSLMSSEDYLEATERLLKLTVKTQHKEREIIAVILTCCLREKAAFNPFYSQLTEKLCSIDRKYRMAAQYAIWDKVKEMDGLKAHEAKNLSLYASKLIQGETLSLASLKVIEFSDLNKTLVKFLKRVITELLSGGGGHCNEKTFTVIAGHKNLAPFREGLKLFIRHFMLKSAEPELKQKLETAEAWLSSGDKRLSL